MTKRIWMLAGVLTMGAAGAMAQVPAGAPAGSTGICKDGTYSNAASKSGACRGHKGVQTWYVASAPAAPAPTPDAGAAAMPGPTQAASPVASAPAPTPAASTAKLGPVAAAAAKTAAPGGGPGLVWVNTSSNVYHCYGDPYYGKTKVGQYVTEDAARKNGAHGVGGRSCPAR